MEAFPFALVLWLTTGAIIGLLGAKLLPGRPPLNPLATMGMGATGALVGGLVATALGFGGIVGYDIRALGLAALVAAFDVAMWRFARLDRSGGGSGA